MSIKELEEVISQSNKLLVIKVNADWCAACKKMEMNIMRILPNYYDKADLIQVSIEHTPEIIKKFNVNIIPTVIFVRNGITLGFKSGVMKPADFEEIVKKFLNDTEK